ncbi:sensor histidine kinase [Halovenus amylolytica]|uniref:sensor histidine kinase n=1 Tax=Halovenus amylolytica TaxID=2500550 RepID=UPI003615FB7C
MVSIERYPDPACSYCFEDGKPIVEEGNDEFGSICNLDQGDPLQKLFETSLSFRRPRPTFEQTERLRVQNGTSEEYLVRVIPPGDDEPGLLLFTAVDEQTETTSLGVDRMASVLSHDLRNPLDVARARLRAGRELDEDKQFDHVEQAHDRIERIIQDVLTLARGEDVVNPEQRADMGELARVAWQTVETNGATFEVTDDLPTVVVDRDRASRLFENLFRNAVEHGSTSPQSQAPDDAVEHGSMSPQSQAPDDAVEHGSMSPQSQAPDDAVEHGSMSPQSQAPDDAVEHGSTSPDSEASQEAVEHGAPGGRNPTQSGTVTVTVGQFSDGVYVSDDGTGIPEDRQDRIFEPGYSSDEHGTGLGLAIVERIADLHGWAVDVRTSESGGARFEITGMDSE